MCSLQITYLKTGLSKVVDASKYTLNDFLLTFEKYVDAGCSIKILRG